jgi:hypothetical protein
MKTLGQIAYEACLENWGDAGRFPWADQDKELKGGWEAAARAVKEATIRVCIEAADCVEQFPEKKEGK